MLELVRVGGVGYELCGVGGRVEDVGEVDLGLEVKVEGRGDVEFYVEGGLRIMSEGIEDWFEKKWDKYEMR